MLIELPPMIVMTSPKTWWTLDGFFYLLKKYARPSPQVHIFGYGENLIDSEDFEACYHSLGDFSDYPRSKWSDSLLIALEVMREVSDTVWFMMDDYWIIREVDMLSISALHRYMAPDVVKIDLTTDRLYAERGEPYLYGKRTIDRVRYLDIIESDRRTSYHMSLWSGLWSIDLLRQIIIPGETAQEIEVNGTRRLGDRPDLRVLGTRQAPLLHTNIIRGGGDPVYEGYVVDGHAVNGVQPRDLEDMKQRGVDIR